MKLNATHKQVLLAALKHYLSTIPPGDEEESVCLDLTSWVEQRDLWAVPPDTIEKIQAHVGELDSLHGKLQELTNTYIKGVQQQCKHRIRRTNDRWSCGICGKTGDR